MAGVYIHIPYCRSRCPYCDFASEAVPGGVPEEFVDGLCAEIASASGPKRVTSVFFGGGTPSLLDDEQLNGVLSVMEDRFRPDDPEVSLEANPDDVTPELAAMWREAGVNRISLGVQSFDDRVLAYLGRRHGAAKAREACGIVAELFENWSMDLIFGARPIEAWSETLAECRDWAPAHVSCYGLSYEANTPFGARAHEAVDDDAYLALFREAEAVLSEYEHYEISNYAKPGYQARHNLVYWRNEEYYGFGPSAYSFIGGVRAANPDDAALYLHAPAMKAETLALTGHEMRVETVIQHLRLREGLGLAAYRERFGRELLDDFGPAIEQLRSRGLVETVGRDAPEAVLRPTRAGFELNNEIGLALLE